MKESIEHLYAADIFAGGGGLSVGLKRAGFAVSAAIEIDKHAVETYRVNHPETVTFCTDVRKLSGQEIEKSSGSGSIDLLAGCPPCQGFSSLTSKYRRDDPRNKLIHEFTRLVEEISPTAVMLENVPGLLVKGKPLLDEAISKLESLGYHVSYDILQVADYGIPQNRRRLVLLAGKGFRIPIPAPTHSNNGDAAKKKWKTVQEAIGHLTDPPTLSYAKANGGVQSFKWHVVRDLSEINKKRLLHAKPGMSRSEIPPSIRPTCHKNDAKGFPNVYGRMAWDSPAPTITGGCTTLSKGRFGHPEQNRTISIREAALLQTFPEDYILPSPYMEHTAKIIGNALPCDFAEILAIQCINAIRNHRANLSER